MGSQDERNVFVTNPTTGSPIKKECPFVIFDSSKLHSIPSTNDVDYTGPQAMRFRYISRLIKFSVVLLVISTIILTGYFLAKEEVDEYIAEEKKFHDEIRSYLMTNSENNRILDDGERCEPGKVYKRDDCNTCTCAENGIDYQCTKMLCPNGASFQIQV